MTTRLTLGGDVARYLDGTLLSGTATGGTTSTLVDTSGDSPLDPGDQPSRFDGGSVYVHTGTNLGEERKISTYTPASGTLAVSSNRLFHATTVIDTTSQYYVLRTMSWADIVDCINFVLRKLAFRTTSPLTLVTDGDMEATGTTDWTASGATIAKNTTPANVPYLGNIQSLQMIIAASGDYAESAAINVKQNEPHYVEALVRHNLSIMTPKIVVRDQTNAADIALDGAATADSRFNNTWILLHSGFTTPSGCRSIAVRLTVDAVTGTLTSSRVYWDNVILLPTRDNIFPAPTWATDGVVERVFSLPRTGEIPAFRIPEPVASWALHKDRVATNIGYVEVQGMRSYSLHAEGLRLYDTLSADTSDTDAPRDLVVAGALAEAYLRLSAETGKDTAPFTKKAAQWKTTFDNLLGDWDRRLHRRLQTRPF